MAKDKTKEDLGIKTNTPMGVKWEQVKDSQKEAKLNAQLNIKIADALIFLAEKESKAEKEKL